MQQQNAARTAEAYRVQQIMTATSEGLTLILYNGALKFISEGIQAKSKKDYANANISLVKAQNIISEFRVTLKMEYEIAQQLLPLYNYIYDLLVAGNMYDNIEQLQEAKSLLTELRDTWHQAMKIACRERGGGDG